MSTRKHRGSRFQLACPEQLEARAMLAGHGPGGGAALARIFGGPAVFQQAIQRAAAQFTSSASTTARDAAIADLGSHCGGAETSTFSTTLTDDAGQSATVTAKTKTYDGETETSVTVNVTGAAANSTLDVTLNGEVIGSVTTDANGAGKASFKDLTTEVADGTTVGVGTLTGTLVLASTTTPGEDHGTRTVLRTSLSDETSGLLATVKYKAFTDEDDTTTSNLVVRVKGATANSSLDVAIDGTVVGQVTTDENGAGKATFTDVTASAGSTVTVGTLSGTLEAVSTHFGHWRWHR